MDPAGSASYRTFQEFWPFYVSQHTRRGTRALHFTGTTLRMTAEAARLGYPESAPAGTAAGHPVS